MYKWVAKQSIEVLVALNVDGSSPSGHPKEISLKGNVFFVRRPNETSLKGNVFFVRRPNETSP